MGLPSREAQACVLFDSLTRPVRIHLVKQAELEHAALLAALCSQDCSSPSHDSWQG